MPGAKEALELLSPELSGVGRLAELESEVSERLARIYAGAFPKQCHNCGREYATKEEYEAETRRLRGTSAVFWAEDDEVQEYRDCACGSTLVVVTSDRRDDSPRGEARRALFTRCVERLVAGGIARPKAITMIRTIMRRAMRRG